MKPKINIDSGVHFQKSSTRFATPEMSILNLCSRHVSVLVVLPIAQFSKYVFLRGWRTIAILPHNDTLGCDQGMKWSIIMADPGGTTQGDNASLVANPSVHFARIYLPTSPFILSLGNPGDFESWIHSRCQSADCLNWDQESSMKRDILGNNIFNMFYFKYPMSRYTSTRLKSFGIVI